MNFLRNARALKESFQHTLVDLQNHFVVKAVTWGFKSMLNKPDLQRLGSPYGGWFAPTDEILARYKNKFLISVGLGHDVTFDQALLERNFTVLGLDPIEECVNYAENQLRSKRVTFLRCGLSYFSGTQTFYPPKNSTHDAWSSSNAQNVSPNKGKTFEVISFEDLYSKFFNANSIDFLMLKMDIEGGEEPILLRFPKTSNHIQMLGVEMDFLSLLPFLSVAKRIVKIRNARQILRHLQNQDFFYVHNEGFNFFWIHKSFSESIGEI